MIAKNIILCVDDEITILHALKAELKSIFTSNFSIEVAQSGSEAIELIEELLADQHQIPLIISDYLMPQMRGDELLKHIHAKSPESIKIMLTGHATVDGVAYAITHARLYRYISKPWQQEDFKLTVTEAIGRYFQDQDIKNKNSALEALTIQQAQLIETLKQNELRLQQLNEQLNCALQNEIRLRKLTVEQEEHNQKLSVLSHTDSLTGIANRRLFDVFLQKEWERAMLSKQPLALGMVDIDWFKKYNDYYGHQAGDDCLQYVAQFLQTDIRRENDLVARYGGEEFAFIFPTTSAESALQKARAICQGLENLAIEHEFSPYKKVTASIGVTAFIPTPDMTLKSMVELADNALYKAKEHGRNQARLSQYNPNNKLF